MSRRRRSASAAVKGETPAAAVEGVVVEDDEAAAAAATGCVVCGGGVGGGGAWVVSCGLDGKGGRGRVRESDGARGRRPTKRPSPLALAQKHAPSRQSPLASSGRGAAAARGARRRRARRAVRSCSARTRRALLRPAMMAQGSSLSLLLFVWCVAVSMRVCGCVCAIAWVIECADVAVLRRSLQVCIWRRGMSGDARARSRNARGGRRRAMLTPTPTPTAADGAGALSTPLCALFRSETYTQTVLRSSCSSTSYRTRALSRRSPLLRPNFQSSKKAARAEEPTQPLSLSPRAHTHTRLRTTNNSNHDAGLDGRARGAAEPAGGTTLG